MRTVIMVMVMAIILLIVMALPARAVEDPLTITVNFNHFTLTLTDARNVVVVTYPVALPKPAENPRLPVTGYVQDIENPAWWRPTARSIRYYAEHKRIHLPVVVPPGHPLNAMGAAKIIVIYTSPGAKATARIHGTNEPKSIGTRASGGCIRMHNKDVLDLITRIRGRPTNVVFER